jgi:hypothetical protein
VRSSVWIRRKLTGKTDAAVWTETDQYLSTQNQKFNIYGGIRFQPLKGFFLTPMAGYSWDIRSSILNQGFSPAAFWEFRQRLSSGAEYGTTAMFRYKFISPRKQVNFFWDQQVKKTFGSNAAVFAGMRAASHELDDFASAMVKRIVSDTLAPVAGLTYAFSFPLQWTSQNKFQLLRRRFLYEPLPAGSINQNNLTFYGLEINLLQEFHFETKKIQANAVYEFEYYNRRYSLENNMGFSETEFEKATEKEKEKDYLRNSQKWEANARWNFSRRSSAFIRTGSQYVQYDTPSDINYDDRDELTYLGTAEIRTSWRKELTTTFGLTGNFRHYAFLFGKRSQDNYIQRSLRAEFNFVFRPFTAVTFTGQNAVYVSYNVKDFRDYGKTDRSTRNLETNLKMDWNISPQWQMRTTFNRKETQQSYLNWEEFSETTLDTNRIINVEQMWAKRIKSRKHSDAWRIEFGYRHYSQVRRQVALMNSDFQPAKNIILHIINLQTGPQAGVKFNGRKGNSISFVWWLQNQVKFYRYKETSRLALSPQTFHENELSKTRYDLEFYPNMALQITF